MTIRKSILENNERLQREQFIMRIIQTRNVQQIVI